MLDVFKGQPGGLCGQSHERSEAGRSGRHQQGRAGCVVLQTVFQVSGYSLSMSKDVIAGF